MSEIRKTFNSSDDFVLAVIKKVKAMYSDLYPDVFKSEPSVHFAFSEEKLLLQSIVFSFWDRLIVENDKIVFMDCHKGPITLLNYDSFEEFLFI